MADLAYPGALQGATTAAAQGVAPLRFVGTGYQRLPSSSTDIRHLRAATGTISDQVVLKSGAGEVPFALGRVWLLRLADGYKAWEGWSDADGYYTATGLELGVEYVAVAIDPTRTHKTTGAGPVTAT